MKTEEGWEQADAKWQKTKIGGGLTLAIALALSSPALAQQHSITNIYLLGQELQQGRFVGEQISGYDGIISTAHGFPAYQIPYLVGNGQISLVSQPVFALDRHGFLVEGIISAQPNESLGIFRSTTTQIINTSPLEVSQIESIPYSLPYEHISLRNQNGEIKNLSQYEPIEGDSGSILYNNQTNQILGMYIFRSMDDNGELEHGYISFVPGQYFGDLYTIIQERRGDQIFGRIIEGAGFFQIKGVEDNHIVLIKGNDILPLTFEEYVILSESIQTLPRINQIALSLGLPKDSDKVVVFNKLQTFMADVSALYTPE